jgi:hypothetical protein
MLFYVLAAITVPIVGLRGLASILFVSAVLAMWSNIPPHDLPISKYHADFLAGILPFMAVPHLKRLGFAIPFAAGCAALYIVIARGWGDYFCFPFFSFIVAAVNFGYDWKVLRPEVLLGDISYSLYMVHPLVFGVGYKAIAMLQPLSLWTQEPIRSAAICVCCLTSYVTWRVIETPANQMGHEIALRITRKAQVYSSPAIPNKGITKINYLLWRPEVRLSLSRQKTGVPFDVPIMPTLKEAIDAMPPSMTSREAALQSSRRRVSNAARARRASGGANSVVRSRTREAAVATDLRGISYQDMVDARTRSFQ